MSSFRAAVSRKLGAQSGAQSGPRQSGPALGSASLGSAVAVLHDGHRAAPRVHRRGAMTKTSNNKQQLNVDAWGI
ncbi:unnamed protein product [Arctogadus glacialis]